MAASLMEKLTNFLMPLEEEEEIAAAPVRQSKNPPQLTVHEGAARRGEEFSITVVVPRAYENVCSYADFLLQGKGLIVNFSCLTAEEQRSMADFLEGVCAVCEAGSLVVEERLIIYAPRQVEIEKQLFGGYSVPAYGKHA